MFGLMTAAAHEKAMTFARQEHERIKTKAHLERQCDHRALDAERADKAKLRAEREFADAAVMDLMAKIEAMRPDYELGRKRRAACERENAKRKAARAGK